MLMHTAALQWTTTGALKVKAIYVLLEKSISSQRCLTCFCCNKIETFMCVYITVPLCTKRSWFFISLPSLHLSFTDCISAFIPLSFFLILPSPSSPNPPSVQRQGTGSRHWLDFHTVLSTEQHIKLIRVNNSGVALLSRAPISLAWPGSGHADGLGNPCSERPGLGWRWEYSGLGVGGAGVRKQLKSDTVADELEDGSFRYTNIYLTCWLHSRSLHISSTFCQMSIDFMLHSPVLDPMLLVVSVRFI